MFSSPSRSPGEGRLLLRIARPVWLLLGIVAASWLSPAAAAADLDEARRMFRRGEYQAALEAAQASAEDPSPGVGRRILRIDALTTLGRYERAAREGRAMADAEPWNVRAMMRAREALRRTGRADEAQRLLERINTVAGRRLARLSDPQERVALGRAALAMGAEPRLVLENFFDRAKEHDPGARSAYLAAARLALDKHDYAMAAKQFRAGTKRFGDDPAFHQGLAEALEPSDREGMIRSLDAALQINPRYAPSLLLMAEHLIDAEQYAKAGRTLDRILEVNPWRPEAWALKAVLAHLDNDPAAERAAREKALHYWADNPEVDSLIGRKLSRKYRFRDAAASQRRALEMDPAYLPAAMQLGQDLLRLGKMEKGWELIRRVRERDGYNVRAYNLMTLHDRLVGFATLRRDGIVLRMTDHEAEVYGERVMDLLQEAKDTLGSRYGVSLEGGEPILVELYPQQQDFAIRTFGVPGGAGYLGVCFGSVITANSPASPAAGKANWEAVLWHEFCHAITLHRTRNRMPRWLSEGISVYEESRRDGAWGRRMTPAYREMILGGELTPVGDLSAAFLNPPSGAALQFAYYESALVVEFLVERHGMGGLRAILADLAGGTPIYQAIEKHAAPMAEIEEAFQAFARNRAENLAPDADWEKPEGGEIGAGDPEALAAWVQRHPNNIRGLNRYGAALIEAGRWRAAIEPLTKLIELYPEHAEAHRLLAKAYRMLGEHDRERRTLSDLAAFSSDAVDACRRLMALAAEAEDWPALARDAERYLAVSPLQAEPYERLARAAIKMGERDRAAAALRRALQLDPADPAAAHLRLARLLRKEDHRAAKRHVLDALAAAPRYRAAQRLLLEWTGERENARFSPPVPGGE